MRILPGFVAWVSAMAWCGAAPFRVDVGGPYRVYPGGTVALSATARSVDCPPDDLDYAWDLNGDGLYDDAMGSSPSLGYSQVVAMGIPVGGVHTSIAVRVTDCNGHSSTGTTHFVVPAAHRIGSPERYAQLAHEWHITAFDLSGDGNRMVLYTVPFQTGATNTLEVLEWDGTDWVRLGAVVEDMPAWHSSYASASLCHDGSSVAVYGPSASEVPGEGYLIRVLRWDGTNWVNRGGDMLWEKAGVLVELSGDGNRLAVVESGEMLTPTDDGPITVLDWNGTDWEGISHVIQGATSNSGFGRVALSHDGSRLAATQFHPEGIATNRPNLVVFERSGTNWLEVGNGTLGRDEAAAELSGVWPIALSSDGNTVAFGAQSASLPGLDWAGRIHVYDLREGTWHARPNSPTGNLPWSAYGSFLRMSGDGNRILTISQFLKIPVVTEDPISTNEYHTGHAVLLDWNGREWKQTPFEVFGSRDLPVYYGELSESGNRVLLLHTSESGFVRESQWVAYELGETQGLPPQLHVVHPDPNGIDPGGPYRIPEGQPLALSADVYGNGADPEALAWDLNGDGLFGDATGTMPLLDWPDLLALGLPSDGSSLAVKARLNGATGTVSVAIGSLSHAPVGGTLPPGTSVDFSGNGQRIAVGRAGSGAPGTAVVLDRVGDDWVQAGATIPDPFATESFGTEVRISGDGQTVLVGSGSYGFGNPDGTVQVFRWNGGNWSLQPTPFPTPFGNHSSTIHTNPGGGVVFDVSDDGNTLAHSFFHFGDSHEAQGLVHVVEWTGSEWRVLGGPFVGEQTGARLGMGVSLSANGKRLAIHEPGFQVDLAYKGRVRVWDWTGSAWIPVGDPLRTRSWDFARPNGIRLSADGTRLSFPDEKAIRVVEWNGVSWIPMGKGIPADFSSSATAVLTGDGNSLLVPVAEDQRRCPDEMARMYQWSGRSWLPSPCVPTDSYLVFGGWNPMALDGDGATWALASEDAVQVYETTGTFTNFPATLAISNLPPVIVSSGGPYACATNTQQLVAAAMDPGNDPLTYRWDLDNDGQFDDATGSNPILDASLLFDLGIAVDCGTNLISLQVDDAEGGIAVTQTYLLVFVDTDFDGMDDRWESNVFTNLTTATEISDYDRDGQSDVDEYRSGTAPHDKTDVLKITAMVHPGHFTWQVVTNRSYRIQHRAELLSGTWTNIVSGNVSGVYADDDTNRVNRTTGQYRVQAE